MRCVVLIHDAELAEGFGSDAIEARLDAMEQLPLVYRDYSEDEFTFEYHWE